MQAVGALVEVTEKEIKTVDRPLIGRRSQILTRNINSVLTIMYWLVIQHKTVQNCTGELTLTGMSFLNALDRVHSSLGRQLGHSHDLASWRSPGMPCSPRTPKQRHIRWSKHKNSKSPWKVFYTLKNVNTEKCDRLSRFFRWKGEVDRQSLHLYVCFFIFFKSLLTLTDKPHRIQRACTHLLYVLNMCILFWNN